MTKTIPLATAEQKQKAEEVKTATITVLPHENWTKKVRIPPAAQIVSANELTSLTALIAYVASRSNSNEYRVERQLSDRFNVPNVKHLPSASYDDAIRYLVDNINGVVHL